MVAINKQKREREYVQILNNLKRNGTLNGYIAQIEVVPSNEELLCFIFSQIGESVDLEIQDYIMGKDTNVIRIIKKEILDRVDYFNLHAIKHNMTLRKKVFEQYVNNYENPFLIDRKKYDAAFENQNMDELEKATFGIFWSNKAAKVVSVMMSGVIEKILEKQKSTVTHSGIYRKLKKFESDCLLSNFQDDENEKYNLRDSYVSDYNSYIYGDYDESTLQSLESYKLVSKKLKEINSNSKYNFSMEDAYSFLGLAAAEQSLYSAKTAFIEKAFKEIAEKKEDKEYGVAIKDDLTQSSKNELEQDMYNKVLTIALMDFSAPVKVHVNEDVIQDYEERYNVEVRNGTYKRFDDGLFYRKYNDEEKKQIKNLNDGSIMMKIHDLDAIEIIQGQLTNGVEETFVPNRDKKVR